MQKDIRTKGETTNTKEGDKLRQVGHDVNASLKENVGVGVGNYSSTEDRQRSNMYEKSHDIKDEKQRMQSSYPSGTSFPRESDFSQEMREGKQDWKEGERKTTIIKEDDVTGALGHKVMEIGREINASMKQNVGIGLGNYSSEKDRERASEHKEIYEKKIEPTKREVEEKKELAKEKLEEGKQVLEEKKEQVKGKLEEGKQVLEEKLEEGKQKLEEGKLTHRVQQIAHDVNAVLKENVGIGLGDYPSEVDREKSKEHWETFQEKVKEEQKPEIDEGTTVIGHKIREVVHNINANLKEVIGVGFGNYSSEVDRELATLHKEEYEKSDLKKDKDELKSDLKEKKDELKSDLKEKKDELKSDVKSEVKDFKTQLREKKEELKEVDSDLKDK